MTHTQEWINTWKMPYIAHNQPTKFNYIVVYPENLVLGKYFDIGAFTYLQAEFGIEIQNLVEIGGGCHIYSHSTIDNKSGKVTLKRNCKIGAHSVIMPGVTVGENSIIGAMSFVNKDVPDDTTVRGVPAKES